MSYDSYVKEQMSQYNNTTWVMAHDSFPEQIFCMKIILYDSYVAWVVANKKMLHDKYAKWQLYHMTYAEWQSCQMIVMSHGSYVEQQICRTTNIPNNCHVTW